MLEQLKDRLYSFIIERLLKDGMFIHRLDSALKQHNKQLEILKEVAEKAKVEADLLWEKMLKDACKKKRLTNNKRA